ncbi:uncharacterized protein LOC129585440 [Paramacrobiotus metropolitanus]|uniref:uncharacterized protein LOC129585440 n=1 Tax=Paramacrobiotus metropolitanus TaxID=2943436 RepID=UPI002446585A|nr:uncharacterized protein LOC129585440 [Paramacrobiotus metropolitanus]
MFLASELSDGFRIMEGTNNIHLLFFRVMELTCILASTLPFHYVTFLGLTIKRLFRMGFVSFHSNIFLDDGDQDPADEYWLIKNAVKNLERFAKEEPTCIFQLAEHVFLPESIVESCESALKKILNLDPFKYSIEEIKLYCMGKVITAHSHHRIDSENTIDFQDATLLSMLLDFSSSSVSEYSSAGNNVRKVSHLEDKDSTSPSSSCANSSSGSFAPLPSSDTVNFKSIPSISVMPNWSSFTLLFRHSNGAIRPHRVHVLKISPSFHLALIGQAQSGNLVSYLYDALQIMVTHVHSTKYQESQSSKKEMLKLWRLWRKVIRTRNIKGH